ncbi:hypothetical protein CDAR_390131 [Caerostris darwini]|uniref:Uncharacterized protein n=1 Tax=Caerostris darwini TaxID=1538125 RepID=A0AAV4RU26_9ARAC|nr:hypothetical protein CDAR_390131 [Caerostris darwini]
MQELNLALSALHPLKSLEPDNIHSLMISRLSNKGKQSLSTGTNICSFEEPTLIGCYYSRPVIIWLRKKFPCSLFSTDQWEDFKDFSTLLRS